MERGQLEEEEQEGIKIRVTKAIQRHQEEEVETSQLFVYKTENVSKPEKKMATFVLIHAPIYKCKRNLAFYLVYLV